MEDPEKAFMAATFYRFILETTFITREHHHKLAYM